MALAASPYPLLNLFWTMFIFFLWLIWIWILITVFIDIFRSRDLSGWAKALWFLFVLFIPLIGVLAYPDRPRRLDARAGGRAGGRRVMIRSATGQQAVLGALQWLVIQPLRPR
jgi:hypothetical protein